MRNQLLVEYQSQLSKALKHLEYSYNKVTSLQTKNLDDEQLETWESFTARFTRVIDLYLTKYLKALILQDDPGFSGSLRDFVNQAEKLGLVESADRWMEFRGFRNSVANEYTNAEDSEDFLISIRDCCEEVLTIKDQLDKA